MMRRLLMPAICLALAAGCMGGPPTRSVANDPAEMARRHAEVNARRAAMTASSDAAQARMRAAGAQSSGTSGGGTRDHLTWQQRRDRDRAQCVLRATRDQLNRGVCN